MLFDSAFLDELRNRTKLTSLIGRRSRLVRSGRNWKTCCPFHGEKTPSFYIYDDHFHCFGCGAHGDAISFVMQSEGRSFPEAVEALAAEAGLEMPVPDPNAVQKAREAKSLADVLLLVQESYRRRLYRAEGRAGLAYLRDRGLSDATIERFGLGWSGDGRGLVDELASQDITAAMLAQAGLMRVDENGAPKGELFFNRVTFPIRDRKGRVISFGGRLLGDGQPKYLNGPETALFSKRRTLFNLDKAREAVHKGAALVVVEGYMDVIALDQAGFGGAVAPLGTALGAEQLDLLWRLSPAPIICLDGDAAGARAALRACEVALPLLSAERTLRFCRLDPKDDPDSLIRTRGPAAMQAALSGATSLADELFALVTAGEGSPGPERRAALREKLASLAQLIPDRVLSSEFRSTLMEMFFARFRPQRPARSSRRADAGRAPPLHSPKSVLRAPRPVAEGETERLNVLTALLLRHPEILPQVEQAYSRLALPERLEALRSALMDWAEQDGELRAEACMAWLQAHGLGPLAKEILAGPLPRDGGSGRPGVDEMLKTGVMESWWHFYALVNFPAFERDVQRDVQRTILQAYSAEGASGGEGGEDVKNFPPGLLARMRVLEALRRGEMPDMEGEAG